MADSSRIDADITVRLEKKLDQLVRLQDETVHLQRVALLKDGHILEFPHAGHRIALSLPDAQRDYIQRVILRTHGFFERKLLADLEATGHIPKDAVIYDIGANIGNHTVYFAAVMGAKKVVSFEPQQHAFQILNANVKLNNLKGIKTYDCALGAKKGKVAVALHKPLNSGGTSFADTKDGAFEQRTLDSVITAEKDKKIDFVKIDVEGMQMAVLQGATKMLKTLKPVLWIEILDRDGDAGAVTALLKDFGYRAQKLGPQDYLFTPNA